MSVFARLQPRLQDAIVARLGWTSLRPVQEEAGLALLDGRNAVVLAPTAGGKTEAALFPALSMMIASPPTGVAALYVAPIKALLNNQARRLGLYTEMVGLRRFVWHGDATASDKEAFKREPTDLLMTTPESLEVMLASARVPTRRLFGDLRMVVIDEVHALAGTDRGAHLMSVLERLATLTPHDVQRVGLSATVGNPEAILEWLRGSSEREGVMVDPPKPRARRELLVIHRESLQDIARDAATMAAGHKSLFFCQSRATTESVATRMQAVGTEVFVHHSSVSKEERERAEERFHVGSDACIVCTSTLELGIDVGDLDRVLQADAPDTVSSFMQRMGRTGRRTGKTANTTFFCESTEAVLQAVALIELAKEGWVEPVQVERRCWPVLVHQLLAMTLADGAVTPQAAWDILHRVPDLSGIARSEFDEVVAHMVAEGYLFAEGGRLAMGERAERVYGRKNFMELYAVFSSPQLYTVVTMSGRELGSLQQSFVDRLVEDASCFLLGGRPWLVERVNHKERRIRVIAAPRGRKPSWGGYLPMFLGPEVCGKVREVLVGEQDCGYLHPSAAEVLADRRADLGEMLRDGISVRVDGESTWWWTFAGGRINQTLKHVLVRLGCEKVVADNLVVRWLSPSGKEEELDPPTELRRPKTWSEELRSAVEAGLPPYRLSKFQRALPSWAQREMLAGYLLDWEGARGVVFGARRRK